ncbi:MAG: inner membrane-spanning protein YciB [Rhodobacterales bacterium]|jgi:intracellular septation protein|nr:septation protein IspZ [Pseudomonadota bacterium]NQW15436.1 septation protein IspZ [Rhodobacter sp.]HBN32067.1 intracellular septation protein A [Paracoccaceae bacterium]
MTEKKPISTGLKLALELGPVILFFFGYSKIKDKTFTILGTDYQGFIIATTVFIPVILLATGFLWWRTGKLSKMQLMTAVLVVVFGGLGIWFNDERFFKMKPTILYALFAAILGFGLLRGESYLQYVMDGAMPLKREGWMIFTRRMALFFAGLAIANEVVWRTMSTDSWVTFKTFVLTGLLFVFIMSQMKLFTRFAKDDSHKD